MRERIVQAEDIFGAYWKMCLAGSRPDTLVANPLDLGVFLTMDAKRTFDAIGVKVHYSQECPKGTLYLQRERT